MIALWTEPEEDHLVFLKMSGVLVSEICRRLRKTKGQVNSKWSHIRQKRSDIDFSAKKPIRRGLGKRIKLSQQKPDAPIRRYVDPLLHVEVTVYPAHTAKYALKATDSILRRWQI